MSVFEPIKLGWRDREYVIPPDRVLRAIAIIEDHITLVELTRYAASGSAPLAKIASAFAAVINYAAGVPSLSADDVYAGMFGSSEDNARAQAAIGALLAMMVPPSARPVANGAAVKNSQGAGPASKSRLKRRSDGASRRRSSGV